MCFVPWVPRLTFNVLQFLLQTAHSAAVIHRNSVITPEHSRAAAGAQVTGVLGRQQGAGRPKGAGRPRGGA